MNPWEIAKWRFDQIGPLIDDQVSEAERRARLRKAASQRVPWPVPKDGEPVMKPISAKTLRRWIAAYQAEKIVGLLPKERCDKGQPRTDRCRAINFALGLLYEEPDRSLTQLMAYLAIDFPGLKLSRSNLHRDLQAHPAYRGVLARRSGASAELCSRYQAEFPHDSWQLDGKGPFEVWFTGGKRIKVHVLTVLDDCSRHVLASIIALAEDTAAAVRVTRLAISKWGIGSRFQFDRGSAFDSKNFRDGLAQLGLHRNAVKAKNPKAQGKIEAFHRSLSRWFVRELRHQEVADLAHLEGLLQAMIEELYNKHYHRALKKSPEAALAGRVSKRALGREEIRRAFRKEKTLKSDPKTGEVALPNGSFRVPKERAGKRFTFTYDPVEREAFLLLRGQPEIPLQPFETLRPFFWEDHSEKYGAGQLQKLYELWRGRKRPNAQPGFGLPEVFQQLERLLGRTLPLCDREASKIQHFYAGRSGLQRSGHQNPGRSWGRQAPFDLPQAPIKANRRREETRRPHMNSTAPFPYKDFSRAERSLEEAILNHSDDYVLLSAETGAGKTSLLRSIVARLDRCRTRVLFLHCDRKLGASGLIRVVARSLRISPHRSSAETIQLIAQRLAEEPQQTALILDNAQELPEETLFEARSLAESQLDRHCCLTLILVGLPLLREQIQSIPQLWRRFLIREELTGLTRDEMPAFVEHHFGSELLKQFPPESLRLIFERGRGVPGLLLPMLKVAQRSQDTKDPTLLDDLLQRWDLP